MSRQISYSGDVTVNLASYSGANSYMYVANANRAANSSANTTYATLSSSTINQAAYAWYIFENISIPEEATIDSVSCNARIYIYRNQSRGTNGLQLMAGNTEKGDETTVATSTTSANTVSVAPGSWTASEINNNNIVLRLRITRTSNSGSQTVRFYGATLKVTYSLNGIEYEVTVNNSTSATTDPTGTTYVYQSLEQEIRFYIDNTNNIKVTDNNTDITSQLVLDQNVTSTFIPTGNTNNGFTLTDIGNAYSDADSDDYAQLQLGGGSTGTLYLNFGVNLPTDCTIQSVVVKATFQYNRNNSDSNYTGMCQMYAGTTSKGQSTTIVPTGNTDVGKTTFTLNSGTWSISELSNARLYITATNNASRATRYLYVYGVSLEITYKVNQNIYVYTISNISADHTIVISEASAGKTYLKTSAGWVEMQKVYKKVNNSWAEQTDLTNVFEPGKIYIRDL